MTSVTYSSKFASAASTAPISFINGCIFALLDFPIWIAFGSLVFAGALSSFIGSAVILMGAGIFLSATLIGYGSSWRGTIGMIQDVPAALLVVMIGDLVAGLPATGALNDQFTTVITAIGLTTFVTGLLFYVLGRYRLGNLARYLPYPVMAGFLAGTGWLLLSGGVQTIAPDISLQTLFTLPMLLRWVPAFILAALMYFFGQRIATPFFVPTFLVLVGIAFYLVTLLLGISYPQLTADGWYLANISSASVTALQEHINFAGINWRAIAGQFDKILIIAGGSVLAMLLNTSGVEMSLQEDLDLDRDLQVTGLGNMLAAVVGGWPAYVSPAQTSINAPNKQQLPLTAPLYALICVAFYLLGASLLSYVPVLIFAVVLIYIGIDFLVDWLIVPFKNLSRLDYGILLVIVGVVSVFGLLTGVAVGLVLAVLLFVMKYSRIKIIRHQLSGAEQRSRFSRGITQTQYLQSIGAQTQILSLQGYMFFGTANTLLEKVRVLSDNHDVRFVILDFENVTGLDSTALLSFAKMAQALNKRNTQLLFSGLDSLTEQQMREHGDINQLPFASLDDALRYVENLQLQRWQSADDEQSNTLVSNLYTLVPELDVASAIAMMEQQDLNSGDYLMRQGEAAAEMFFIESGLLTAQLEREDGSVLRLQTMGCGHVVGELGFYTGLPRGASIVCEEDATVYFLTKEKMEELDHRAPKVAATIHQLIVHLLANRVSHLVRVVDLLQK